MSSEAPLRATTAIIEVLVDAGLLHDERQLERERHVKTPPSGTATSWSSSHRGPRAARSSRRWEIRLQREGPVATGANHPPTYLSRTSVDTAHMRVYAGWMIHRHHAGERMRIGMEDDVDDSPRIRDRVGEFWIGLSNS